jgi:serine/threonine protein kinase/tetratricopeptide (TPR) repeat protein
MSECGKCGSPLPSDSADCENCATHVFMAVRTVHDKPQIAGYEIINQIGEGGMGTVYLADERSLGRRVAIKIISGKLATDAQSRARFMREARSMATIEHANVIRVYAFGEVEAMPYLAMEYIDGETLADRIRRSGKLSVEDSVRLMRQILLALEAAWEKGIVHRDIKPSNILLDRRDQVHVADFGLAKAASLADDPVLTQSGHVLGTPYYLSPEQAQGLPTDFRSDIYSCGILFYEMLSGERPFEGTTPFAIVAKHLHETLPSIRGKRPDVPNRVAKLIDVMAEKRPERRPQSYAELIGMFDALLGITPTRGISQTATLKVSRPSMRIDRPSTPLIAGAAAVLLFAVALLVYFKPFAKPKSAASPKPASSRFTVAVAPFYGPDPDSAKEGRMMAALIERSITTKLGSGNVTVAGIDETKEPVHSHDAARALGEKLGASVVVWGEAFSLKQETEIQPYFTLVHRKKDEGATTPSAGSARAAVNTADPLAELSEKSTGITRMTAEAPNQIDLRKTSAEGVGEMVMFLAALHAFYERSDPKRTLELLDQVPRTAEALRLRGRAWDQLGHQDDQMGSRAAVARASESREKAASAFEEALALDPKDAQTRADLADVDLLQGKFPQAAAEYARVAAAGQPYLTHYGIAYRGLIYVREVFRGELAAGIQLNDSGYLLAADPVSGVIRHRYRMPGFIRSFTPKDNGFAVEYASDTAGKQITSVTFIGGRFDRPLVIGGNLLLRMRGLKCGWTLAQNFRGDIFSMIDQQAVHPRFRPAAKMSPDTPQTLPELETTLREAIRHDPTQPWHVYHLGETLWAEGRRQEAEAVWASLLSADYGVAYYEYNWMAKYLERFGHNDWADRMAARGLRERQRLPQPVQFTTLIERLINVSYMRMHPEDAKNVERAYGWFKRAREATGPTEFDPYFALAWAGHFRRAGDVTRERTEEAFARVAALIPFNVRMTLIDYAVEFFVLCWCAFALGSALLLVRSAMRVGAMPPSSPMSTWLRLVLVLLAFGALGVLAGFAATSPVRIIPAVLAILGFVVLFVRSPRMRAAVAGISNRERLLVAASFGVALAAAVLFVVAVDRLVAVTQLPIGLADSLGHASILSDLEKRLTQSATPALRYTAAVANQLAGNVDRARQLYRDLPDDARAQRALAALDRGKNEIIMPADSEMIAAFAVGEPRLVALRPELAGDWEFNPAPMAMIYAGTGGALLLFIIFMITPPGVQAAASGTPKNRARRTAAKVFFTFVPGAYDVMRGSAARGFALIGLFGFTLYRVYTVIRIYPHLWLPHFYSTGMPKNAAPLPPDFRKLDLLFMNAYSRLYWTLAILIVVAMLVLHAMRIPAILRLYRDAPTDAAPTLVPSQPTT